MSVNKSERDAEQQAFLSGDRDDIEEVENDYTQEPRFQWGNYLRLVVECGMFLTIILLSIYCITTRRLLPGPSPVPNFPLKTYTFVENPKYMHDGIFNSTDEAIRTLHNWVELSAVGRGYVQVDDNSSSYHLSEPYTLQVHGQDEPVYMMSVFHQLHCLSYLVEHYQTAFEGHELTPELAHHSAHCFDYLRQSIMCNADTTLEGKTEVGPGWGSKHQCKDYDALLEWANKHTILPWRANMIDKSVL